MAATSSSDPLLTAGAEPIADDLRQGVPLVQALRRRYLVPELVVWMVGFGESQGTLCSALHQVAQQQPNISIHVLSFRRISLRHPSGNKLAAKHDDLPVTIAHRLHD